MRASAVPRDSRTCVRSDLCASHSPLPAAQPLPQHQKPAYRHVAPFRAPQQQTQPTRASAQRFRQSASSASEPHAHALLAARSSTASYVRGCCWSCRGHGALGLRARPGVASEASNSRRASHARAIRSSSHPNPDTAPAARRCKRLRSAPTARAPSGCEQIRSHAYGTSDTAACLLCSASLTTRLCCSK